jgi:hypothetical protein
VRGWIERLPWAGIVLACATLGLAPFNPPHVVEKLGMLVRGQLVRPIDVFDLLMHGAPWAFLLARLALASGHRPKAA